ARADERRARVDQREGELSAAGRGGGGSGSGAARADVAPRRGGAARRCDPGRDEDGRDTAVVGQGARGSDRAAWRGAPDEPGAVSGAARDPARRRGGGDSFVGEGSQSGSQRWDARSAREAVRRQGGGASIKPSV